MKKTDKALLKMRFKQLNGTYYPEWREVPLKTLANLATAKNKASEVNRVLTNSAANGIVDQRDYFEKDIANSENLEGYYIVETGDYVYNPRVSNIAPVGPVSKNKVGRGLMSPLYTVFRFISDNNDFYEQYFKTSHWYKYLRSVSNTGARFDRMSITPSVFMDMPVPFPIPEEQQKIASCLFSLDDLIMAHSQKLDALKVHKKGLMQQLFPAEGEKVPKRRFEEFKDSGDWESYPLSEFIASLDAGVSVNSGDKPASENEFGILKTSCVSNGVFDPTENKVVLVDSEIDRLKEPVSSNSIIISRMNTPTLVGANAYIEKGIDNIFLPDRLWAAKPKLNVNMRFVAHVLGSLKGRKELTELASGSSGSMKNISKSDVLEMQILAPKIEEQEKITSCLSSLNELIAKQEKKIEQLKIHKKGLMQGLFPEVKDNN